MTSNNIYSEDFDKLSEFISEYEMLFLLKEYQDKNDQNIFKKIYEKNRKVILAMVEKYSKNNLYEKDDLIQEGNVGFIKAIDTFDINNNLSFNLYLKKCIDKEIFKFIKDNKKYNKISSLDTIISLQEYNLELMDILNTEEENYMFVEDFENKEMYESLQSIIDTLPENKRNIIIWYFGLLGNKNNSLREIGEKVNLKQGVVSLQIQRTLKKLKDIIILNLRFGFADNKMYEIEDIAAFLNISIYEVKYIIEYYMLDEYINKTHSIGLRKLKKR